jgi:CDP-6-deoxy-D-xylo-4-hexulose-3-dehydrase
LRKHIPTFAPVFGQEERSSIVTTTITKEYLTSGKEVDRFERIFSRYIGSQYGVMVNSGSSAAEVAFKAMGWKYGDKIIVPACGFPTPISEPLYCGIIPVFVDCELGTYNPNPQMVEDCINKTDGIIGMIIAHNLGNPLDPDIWNISGWSIEDACDALGSMVNSRMCGSFGDISIHSFYPAHGITTVEGGMCVTRNHNTYETMRSINSWGRDCQCSPGEDDRCKKRFNYMVDGVPYDHKYIVKIPGGNYHVTEDKGTLGILQLSKEMIFRKRKHENFAIIYKILEDIQDRIYLPTSISKAEPAWFGFPITLKSGDRMEICRKLTQSGVQTRMLFAGNLTRHPFIKDGKYKYEVPYELVNSDKVMRDSFVVGCGQSVTEEEAHYIGETVRKAVTG